MKISKRIVAASAIFFAVLSVTLFISILFKTSIDPVFSEFVFLLNSVRICFAMCLAFIILAILLSVVKSEFFTVEKIFSLFSVIICVGIVVFSFSVYSGYNSEWEVWINSDNTRPDVNVNKYLPYKSEIEKVNSEESCYQISKSYADGVVYIDIFNDVYKSVDYAIEYFEIKDKVLNYKFITDREVPSVFNDYDCDVYGEATVGEINGIDYKLYIDGNNYVVAIKGAKYGYYASLYESDVIGVSPEAFIETAVEQFGAMQELAKTDYMF